MKRMLCAVLLVAILIVPGLGVTEGDDTIQLARVMYTLGRDESYETLLMIGTVVANRVDSPWFADSVSEVLGEPHQFPHGTRYDERSLRAAREVMMGLRTLPENVLYVYARDASVLPDESNCYVLSGNYGFYTDKR